MNTLATSTDTPTYPAIERAALQPSTKAQYSKALRNMQAAGIDPRQAEQLQAYADTLKQSSRAFLKSALRLMTADTAYTLKANATPANIGQVQAALYRLEAMQAAIQVTQPKGEKAHLWLSRAQVEQITALPDDTLMGQRDWIVLGLLLGAGLRREELATLTFDALKNLPDKNGQTRTVLQVKGKGAKDRLIPLSATLARRLRIWKAQIGTGSIARALTRGKLGDKLSPIGIFAIVNKYGARIGLPTLAPHDLRRTFAQLSYEAGIPLAQVSKLLGHANVNTTQRYLNLNLDLTTTASDAIPLSGD